MNGGAITASPRFGKAVAREEANRLSELVRLARASGFVTKKA